MTPALLLAQLPSVASAIGLPIPNAPLTVGIVMGIQQVASEFGLEVVAILTSIDAAIMETIRVAFVTCLLIGVVLYFTHIGAGWERTSLRPGRCWSPPRSS
ncbi:MAG TPA: hypothetical protein VLY65_02065 [Nitrososphaerales archaeon]|nr:hypothetical protein [Nitrososphaerales archaeon]